MGILLADQAEILRASMGTADHIRDLLRQRLSVKEVAQVLAVSEWTVVDAIEFGARGV